MVVSEYARHRFVSFLVAIMIIMIDCYEVDVLVLLVAAFWTSEVVTTRRQVILDCAEAKAHVHIWSSTAITFLLVS